MKTNLKEHLQDFEKIDGKRHYKPISECITAIKTLLLNHESYSGDEITEKINEESEKILKYFFELKKLYGNDTKKILPIVLDFFQNLYATFGVTYFYNRSPEISYKEYSDLPTGQQILNNVFDGKVYIRKDCLIKEDYIKGGNCHHRSIAIKKIFNEIDLPGVECKVNFEGHSFISIEFDSNIWIIDMIPQTRDLLKNKLYVLNEKDIQKFGTGGHYGLLDPDNSSMSIYGDIEKYKKNVLEKTKHNSIKLGINNIKLEITRSTISYKYKDPKKDEREIILPIKLEKNVTEYDKIELLEHIFQGIKVFPKQFIPLISKKISKQQLFNIFNN